MLDLRRLSLLVAVGRLGSISAAAAEAGCTPSSASEQLSKLEEELAASLLERSPRSVRLTAAGEELAEQGGLLLAQADATVRAVGEIAGMTRGRVRVAAYQTGAERFVIRAISSFIRAHPHIRVTFDEMEPEAGLAAVADGTADIALVNSYVGLQPPATQGLDVVELGRDPFVLVVPPRLATPSATASLIDFAGSSWVSGRPVSGFQAVTELAASRAGFTPDIVARADNYDLVLELVAGGLGVALVPRTAVHPKAGIHVYGIRKPFDLARCESLVTRAADRSAATAELRAMIIDRYRRNAARVSRGRGAG